MKNSRKRLAIAAVIVFLLTAFAGTSFTYPVRVTFRFNYGGTKAEVSYLTTVTEGLGNVLEIGWIRYTHYRDRTSFKLPDGSLAILRAEWPAESQGFDLGKRYTSVARWFWQDNANQPVQIIYGDSATTPPASRSAPALFTWLDVTATIERLDDAYLIEASRADKIPDNDDKIEFSSQLGGRADFHGMLFSGLVIEPLVPDGQSKIEQLKSSPGWIAASENCRFKPIRPAETGALFDLVHYGDRVGLLRDGMSWSAEGGPLPGEPAVMYSTGRKVEATPNGFSVAAFRDTTMVHSVKWGSKVCNGIDEPSGSTGLIIQFGDGTMALVAPSDFVAVLSD